MDPSFKFSIAPMMDWGEKAYFSMLQKRRLIHLYGPDGDPEP